MTPSQRPACRAINEPSALKQKQRCATAGTADLIGGKTGVGGRDLLGLAARHHGGAVLVRNVKKKAKNAAGSLQI